jgi:hypothetical protein
MKLFIIFILFISSCSQTNLVKSIKQNKFDQLVNENLFDSDLSLRKIKNDSNDIKIIKVQKIKDIISTIVQLSIELKGETIVHFIEFSTNEEFKVDKETLKKIALEKDCNLVVYVEENDISNYTLFSDRKTIEIKEKKGYHFFNAFFYSKVKLNNIYEIKNN